ncbi:MAG: DNA repair protein RecO [Elusimicrobiota bacterium]|jgi:hypothetical protein
MAIAQGLVLRRGVLGESDRFCVLYTAEYGKLPVRFIGVNRPHGKLKALSEPLALGEYRLHLREGSESALCTGGSLTTTHPRLRADLDRLLRALQVCELLDRLTPVSQPSPAKFSLALETLARIEDAEALFSCDWLLISFSLRLLGEAGFGVADLPVTERNRALWDLLHDAPLSEVAALPEDPERRARLEGYLQRSVEGLTEKPLRTLRMRAQLAAPIISPPFSREGLGVGRTPKTAVLPHPALPVGEGILKGRP